MAENYKLIKSYQDDKLIRKSFNELANATFGLDFESWYQNGYWKENYIPYSMVEEDKVVANVSASPMQFRYKGELKTFLQLGTVMTEKAYRRKGLIRQLIKEIEEDFDDVVDGYFLFANDSVLEFYPKFGYQKVSEYEYTKGIRMNTEKTIENIPMNTKEQWKHLENVIKTSHIQSKLWMQENPELIMFYVTQYMSENVYFVRSQEAYVIAELSGEELLLHSVFAPKEVDIDKIIDAFGEEVKKVTLGFTPLESKGYERREFREEDITLFVKGASLEVMETDFLRIPTLSHT